MQGVVQGVGFRPFIYRLATSLGLAGWVRNTPSGVIIEVEGATSLLQEFFDRLPQEKPPLSTITALQTTPITAIGEHRFVIHESEEQGTLSTLLLPDIATCVDCVRDVTTSANRRHRYPFANCTNCGPRFSIVESLPYDRMNTTMARFRMCGLCQAEYYNPHNRRFHAQPNACPSCGPELTLWRRSGNKWMLEGKRNYALQQTVNAIQAGTIVTIKGLGGFHLVVNACNEAQVALLRERKHRPHKPFAVMVRDIEQARVLCEVSPEAERLLSSPQAPIVLLPRRESSCVAGNVASYDTTTLGVMLPTTPLHHLLMRSLDFPIVATSGNQSNEPICTDDRQVIKQIGSIVDVILTHNRPIKRHVDDSVAWVVQGTPQLLRRARGYAPLPIHVAGQSPTILGVGAQQKNSIALSIAAPLDKGAGYGGGTRAIGVESTPIFVSQHIGDLSTIEAHHAFTRVIEDFLHLYHVTPTAIAHDMHPDYYATQWATQSPYPCIAVQHHHAHFASCLAEHNVVARALGVVWDGTGYGLDGMVWGGEFLRGNASHIDRVAHLHPFRLVGGEAAVREPRRVALALLWEVLGDAVLERDDLAPVCSFTPDERLLLVKMAKQEINAPVTTSVGRLLDGCAALLGIHLRTTFEGQAAMRLETIADIANPAVAADDRYPLMVSRAGRAIESQTIPPLIIDWRPMIVAMLNDLHQQVSPAIMAARVHHSLIAMVVEVAQAVGEEQVALTGGCFQNRLLTEGATTHLRAAGFEVLLHQHLPPNDGGISVGQVMVAAATLARETV